MGNRNPFPAQSRREVRHPGRMLTVDFRDISWTAPADESVSRSARQAFYNGFRPGSYAAFRLVATIGSHNPADGGAVFSITLPQTNTA